MSSAQDEKIVGLQGQVKKLQSQKDSLLKELDAVEDRFEKTNRLYRKYFPVIIDSVVTGDNSFSRSCRELSIALKKGDSEGKIEYIFEQLKTAMLKEDLGPVSSPRKKGLFSALVKGGPESFPESFIDEYKQSYHDVVNKLRSNLDKKYTGKLDNITIRIKTAEDTGDISDIRESVFNLILFISQIPIRIGKRSTPLFRKLSVKFSILSPDLQHLISTQIPCFKPVKNLILF